jgi:hypothetical protein
MSHQLGLQWQTWLLHFPAWSLGCNGWRTTNWLVAVLSPHTYTSSLSSLTRCQCHNSQSSIVTPKWSPPRAVVETARPLWPCFGSSRTQLLLNFIGQVSSRDGKYTPPLFLGREAKNLWSSLIYHRHLTGWLSLASALSWNLSRVPLGLRFIWSSVWNNFFSSERHSENMKD